MKNYPNYNELNRKIGTIYFDGSTEESTYDDNGNRLTSKDKLGRISTYVFDSRNRQVKTIYPDTSFTETVYNSLGQVEAEIDARGNRSEFEYDLAGRKIIDRNALEQETTYQHDANGNVRFVTTPDLNMTEFVYDELNRKVSTIYPDDTGDSVVYDALGRVSEKTDPRGNVTQFQYDLMGRLVKVIDAMSGETFYGYDERGHKISETDAKGQTTTWGFDYLGRQVRRTLPLGMSESFTYNSHGLKATHTDFKGDTTSYTYDAHNWLQAVWYPDMTTETYTYNKIGQRRIVKDVRNDFTTYNYDIRDRLESVENSDGSSISYGYDANGNRTILTTVGAPGEPAKTTTYTFDALSRIHTVTDPSVGITTYTYRPNGKPWTTTNPNATVAENSYDTLGRLVYLENRQSDGTILSSYAYTLDADGNRTRIVEHSGRTVDYSYDALNRLTSETITEAGEDTISTSFVMDAVGNRLSQERCVGTNCETSTYAYNLNNQLISETKGAVTSSYFYDTNGNTIEKSVGADSVTYAWDYNNRLVSASTPDHELGFSYDVDGLRVQKSIDSAVVSYLVDKNMPFAQVLEERSQTGTLLASYLYGSDLVSQSRAGGTSFYLYDGLGSTRGLSNMAQAMTDSYDYEAYGSLLEQTGTTENAYRFTGEQEDEETGLVYLRARYYNEANGRFMSHDSWGGELGSPISLNKYIYGGDNPIMKIDPSGEQFTLVECQISVAIVSVLSAIAVPSHGGYLNFDRLDVPRDNRYKSEYGELWYPPTEGASVVSRNVNTALKHRGDFIIGRLLWYFYQVHHDWDYTTIFPDMVPIGDYYVSKFSNLANYNAGATGRALDIPESMLTRLAGGAEITDRYILEPLERLSGIDYNYSNEPYELNFPWGRFPYGDYVRDQYWIKKGIDDFDNWWSHIN